MHDAIRLIQEQLSADRFDQFARLLTNDCQRDGALKWWMQKLWNKIIAQYPEFNQVDLLSLGQTCPVHWGPLFDDEVEIIYGYFNQDYVDAIYTHCPMHNTFVMGPDWGGDEKTTRVRYCKECRAIYLKKFAERE